MKQQKTSDLERKNVFKIVIRFLAELNELVRKHFFKEKYF